MTNTFLFLDLTSPSLIVVTYTNISGIRLSDLKVFPIVDSAEGCRGVDYDVTKGVLYWSETAPPKIRSLLLNGSDESREVVVKTRQGSWPHDIALDWVHGNLYWTDWNLGTIEVINLETRLRKVLIKSKKPLNIVVDPRDDHG